MATALTASRLPRSETATAARILEARAATIEVLAEPDVPPTAPHVEILYFQGCPNYQETRALVERIADELRVDPKIDLVEVPDADAALRLRFLGSPSVRVNGRDIEPGADDRSDASFSCRVYRSDQGLAGQPAEGWVRDALVGA